MIKSKIHQPTAKKEGQKQEPPQKNEKTAFPVLQELRTTEESYLGGLRKLVLFIERLEALEQSKRLKSPETAKFLEKTQCIKIIAALSEKLCEGLNFCSNNQGIVALFLEWLDSSRIYKGYMAFHSEIAVTTSATGFREDKLIAELVTAIFEDGFFGLYSALISPVQRIPRYRLLLEQLLKEQGLDPQKIRDAALSGVSRESIFVKVYVKVLNIMDDINSSLKTSDNAKASFNAPTKQVIFVSKVDFFKEKSVDMPRLEKLLSKDKKILQDGKLKCTLNGKTITFEIKTDTLKMPSGEKLKGFSVKVKTLDYPQGVASLTPGELKECYEIAEKIGLGVIDSLPDPVKSQLKEEGGLFALNISKDEIPTSISASITTADQTRSSRSLARSSISQPSTPSQPFLPQLRAALAQRESLTLTPRFEKEERSMSFSMETEDQTSSTQSSRSQPVPEALLRHIQKSKAPAQTDLASGSDKSEASTASFSPKKKRTGGTATTG